MFRKKKKQWTIHLDAPSRRGNCQEMSVPNRDVSTIHFLNDFGQVRIDVNKIAGRITILWNLEPLARAIYAPAPPTQDELNDAAKALQEMYEDLGAS